MSNVKAVIYARLSQEDMTEGVSQSIHNQISNLQDYIKKCSYELIDVYADDGYTGGNMDRPAFQKMLTDLYQQKFNTIIVKDISRIGRNLIEVGYFMEEVCPSHNIRIISILDKYDSTIYGSDDSIVFRSFMNDYYLKECKKKSFKSIERRITKKPLHTIPFYGFDFINKKLVVNQEEAKVVKKIFEDYSLGKGTFQIARELKENQIPCPAYAMNQKIKAKYPCATPYAWQPFMILTILKRKHYTGTHVNGTHSKHFDLVELENVYEPIIPLELFNKVQKIIPEKSTRKNPPSKYASFIYNKKTGIVGHLERRTTRIVHTKKDKICKETFDQRINLGHISVSVPIFEKILKKEINLLFKELTADKAYLAKMLYKDALQIKKQMNATTSLVKTTESAIKRTIEQRFSNQLDPILYKEKITALNQSLKSLTEELKQLEQQSTTFDEAAYNQAVENFLSIKKKSKDVILIAKTLFKRIQVDKVNGKLILEFQYNI